MIRFYSIFYCHFAGYVYSMTHVNVASSTVIQNSLREYIIHIIELHHLAQNNIERADINNIDLALKTLYDIELLS